MFYHLHNNTALLLKLEPCKIIHAWGRIWQNQGKTIMGSPIVVRLFKTVVEAVVYQLFHAITLSLKSNTPVQFSPSVESDSL